MGADRKANTKGGGALELGDSRLFEDGSERGGALVSDVVAADTAVEGRSENGEKTVVSRALTRKQTLRGAAAHLSEVTALPLSASHSFVMPSAV